MEILPDWLTPQYLLFMLLQVHLFSLVVIAIAPEYIRPIYSTIKVTAPLIIMEVAAGCMFLTSK